MAAKIGLDTESIKILKDKYKKMREDETPLAKADMLMSVMKCNFLSPVDIQPEPVKREDGTLMISPDAKIAFKLIANTDKQKFLLAFTDLEEYKKWSSLPPKTIVVAYEGYEGLVLDRNAADGVVINPFTENIVLTKKVLEVMRKQNELQKKKLN